MIGAGRIGAGFNWTDDAYTHAGAYRAFPDRVELVGFVEPDLERRVKANLKWNVPTYDNLPVALEALKPDIVSVCVQPEQQAETIGRVLPFDIKGIWCEKPFVSAKAWVPIQVNYMRRGDPLHRVIAEGDWGGKLIVYGKDDIHTKCHFEDLAKFWRATLDYRPFNGPCAYIYKTMVTHFFDQGGVNGGECFREMLTNLLDHIDTGVPLWSPAT